MNPVRRTPSLGFTLLTVLLVVVAGAGQVAMAWQGMRVAIDIRDHPFAFGFGGLLIFSALVLFGWTWLPGLLAWSLWTAGAAGVPLAQAPRIHALAEQLGVRPIFGWGAWAVVRLLLAVVVMLTCYQFGSDRGRAPT